MVTLSCRPLTDYESRLLGRLLQPAFPGRDAIAEQIANSQVAQIDPNGSLTFSVKSNTKAGVKRRVPVEGEFEDADGVVIHVLLHVVDGIVNELEIYREDSSPIVSLPDPASLIVPE